MEGMMNDDAEAIRSLMSAYGRMLDLRDYEGWADLFAPGGQWVGGDVYGAISGRADLLAFVTREFASTPPCVHMLGNMAIDLDGDRATAWSRWLLIEQAPDGGMRMALAGSYSDALVRLPDGWRFARREVALDLPVMSTA
jgi:3-phenylpropionate/cinnamic acid dioxygenase small subunit